MNYILYFILLLGINTPNKTSNTPQKGYFRFPLNTGTKTSLSGCFGDIRTNHFHAGLDIRTGGKTGLSVYAAAEGYVSRIRVMMGGYGNAIYITHPNGLTTLYGHLESFSRPIEAYLKTQQYQQQQWAQDIYLQPNEIQVNKGEFIALSGNTGGSGGPHLHFEIRDQEESTLNPASFGFYEIKDSKAPIINFISLVCMEPDARINGKYGRFDFEPFPNKSTGELEIREQIVAKGKIGVEILTYDRVDNSPFKMGVQEIELKKGTELAYSFKLEKQQFHNDDDMNVHVNYERLVFNREKIHKCYVTEGNRLNHYKANVNNGLVRIDASTNLNFRITDTYQNSKYLNVPIIFDNATIHNQMPAPYFGSGNPSSTAQLFENSIIIKAANTEPKTNAIQVIGGAPVYLSYMNGLEKVFIYDLANGVPSGFQIENTTVNSPVNKKISNQNPLVYGQKHTIDFSNALYRPIYTNFLERSNELVLDKDFSPLKGSFSATWTPLVSLTDPEKQKVYLKRKRPKFIGGTWLGNQINFTARELGTYIILSDFTPPTILKKEISPNKLKFKISDDLSGIKDIKCYVNNEWVLMDYEYKNGYIWSEKLQNSIPFTGNVRLEITDKCMNVAVFDTYIN